MALVKFIATIVLVLWVVGLCLSTGQHVANGANWGEALGREQEALGQRAAGCGEAFSDFRNSLWRLPTRSREPVADRMGASCLKLLVPL